MSKLQGFDSYGPGRPKKQIGAGDFCAGGSRIGNVALNDGRYYKDGKCTLCGRPVKRWADGKVQPHISKNPAAEAELERRARPID